MPEYSYDDYECETDLSTPPLFSGWRLLAFADLCKDAGYRVPTGASRWPLRQMVKEWGASAGSVERWISSMCEAGYTRCERVSAGTRSGRAFTLRPLRDEFGYVVDAAVDDMVWPCIKHEVFCRSLGLRNYPYYVPMPPVDIRIRDEHWSPGPVPAVDNRGGIVSGYLGLLRLAAHRSAYVGGHLVEDGTLLTSERYVCAAFGWDANEFEKFVRTGVDTELFEVAPAIGTPKGGIVFYFHGYGTCSTGDVGEWEKAHCWGAVGHMWGRHSSPRKRARTISASVRKRVLERAGHKCEWCESTEKLEVDHIHPVARGGSASESNLQVLCSRCNSHKRDKVFATPPTYAQSP